MKKILLFFVLGVISMSGCTDAIDIEQPGRLGASQAFNSVQDLQLGLVGAYGTLDQTPAMQFNAVFTDQVGIGFQSGGQGIGNGEYGFILNPTSAASSVFWLNYYVTINAVNRIIDAAGTIEIAEDEQAEVDNILGQLFAMRAYAHFELLTYYSTDLTDDSALGVIAVDFIPTIDQILDRNTNGEVFALIESDLTQAETLLADQSNPLLFSRDFVTAMRARMAAYRGDYTGADAFAAQVLQNYELADRTQYLNMYDDDDFTEVIFSIDRAIGDNFDGQGATGSAFAGGWAGAIFAFGNSTIDGTPYYEMSRDLFNILDPADIRFTVMVDETSLIDPGYLSSADPENTDILVISKYAGGTQPLLNDLKIFRASEMVLIRAEAAADRGDFTAAAGFIDQIRDARFGMDMLPPIYTTEAQAFAAILDERRMELAYEGFRWVDLKRLGTRAQVSIERDPVDCAVNGACNLSLPDFRFAVPIPLVELNANSVIQQNPGY